MTVVTMTIEDVVRAVGRVEAGEVRTWIERGWVLCAEMEPAPRLRPIDQARVALIRDLTRDLGLDDEAVPVVLSLVDQVHGLRRRLDALAAAVDAEPADVRAAILKRAAGLR
jgi:chaperone modulatory protein CbpM